ARAAAASGSPALQFGVEVADRSGHAILLLPGQAREDREREHLRRERLGNREVAALVSQLREGGLHRKRDRIVNATSDSVLREMALQRVAALRPDRELVVGVRR